MARAAPSVPLREPRIRNGAGKIGPKSCRFSLVPTSSKPAPPPTPRIDTPSKAYLEFRPTVPFKTRDIITMIVPEI